MTDKERKDRAITRTTSKEEIGHAFMWPVKGKRRMRIDAMTRRRNALKSHAEVIPELMISNSAYLRLKTRGKGK